MLYGGTALPRAGHNTSISDDADYAITNLLASLSIDS